MSFKCWESVALTRSCASALLLHVSEFLLFFFPFKLDRFSTGAINPLARPREAIGYTQI